MHDRNSTYFDACDYACTRLKGSAPRYFPRVYELAKVNSLEELKSIIDGWADGLTPKAGPIPDNLWAPGSRWGESVRVERDRGIVWRLKCSCGRTFTRSTNDTISPDRRKCETCLLADELSLERQKVIARLDIEAAKILEWHKAHNRLIWSRVYKALRRRGIEYISDDSAHELNAMCWAKITSVAGQYHDNGFKVSTWLGIVADNALRDYFKVTTNRGKLAPTQELPEHADRTIPDPNGIKPPARPCRPAGASPSDAALNGAQAKWDARQSDALGKIA